MRKKRAKYLDVLEGKRVNERGSKKYRGKNHAPPSAWFGSPSRAAAGKAWEEGSR
jgi:hypothetical protein